MAEDLKFKFSSEGDAELARAIGNVVARLDALEKQQTKTGVATKSLGAAQAQTGDALTKTTALAGKFGSTMSLAAQGLSTFGGQGGKVVAVLGQAAPAIAGLTAAMGPWGLAIGAASAAFTILSSVLGDAKSDTEKMAAAIRRDAIPAMEDLLAVQQRFNSQLGLRVRQRAGRGTAEEQQAYADELRNWINENARRLSDDQLGQQRRNLATRDTMADRAFQAERMQPDSSREREQHAFALEEAEALLDEQDSARRERERGAAAGGRAASQAERERERRERELDALMSRGTTGAHGGVAGGLLDDADARAEREADAVWKAEAEKIEAYKRTFDVQRDQLAAIGRATEDAHQEQIARTKELTDAFADAGESVAGIFVGVADIMEAEGKNFGKALEHSLDAWLKAFARQEGLKGGASLAEAIGFSFFNPPAAAAKYSESAMHFALAAAAGVGATAFQGAPTGGGAAAGAGAAATPERSPSRSERSEGAGVTVVFNGSMVTASTHAELGRQIAYSLRAAERRGR